MASLICLIHSFTMAISIAPLHVHYYSEALPTTARKLLEFHAEAPHATVSKGLVQFPYATARAGVEPTTVRLRVIDLTNAPPRPTVAGEFSTRLVLELGDNLWINKSLGVLICLR